MENILKINSGNAWRSAPLIALTLLLLVYAPVLLDLLSDWWNDPNYSHGFVVPILSGYLIWKKRERLSEILAEDSSRPSASVGLMILAGAMVLYVVGNGAAEYFTVRVSFVGAIFGLTLYFWGEKFLREIWFELAFLLFMIPLPYVLYYSATFPLQLLATKISMKALAIIGIPAIQQGNIIHLSAQSLEVAEACSGIRSMLSLLALGALYARMGQPTTLGKIALFLSTAPIALMANSVRVFLTALLSHTIEADVLAEPLHSLLGLSVFVIALIALFIVDFLLKRILR